MLALKKACEFLEAAPLGRCIVLLVKLGAVVMCGAAFMKLYGPEDDANPMTWTDAVYFGAVTATSIG